MLLSEHFVLLLLLVVNILILARAAPKQYDIGQSSTGVNNVQIKAPLPLKAVIDLSRNSNHLFEGVNGQSNFRSALRHEDMIDIDKRKSPSSSHSDPNTNSGDLDSTSSSDDDGTDSGQGLDPWDPAASYTFQTTTDPGQGLNPFATVLTANPATTNADSTLNPSTTDAGQGLNPFVVVASSSTSTSTSYSTSRTSTPTMAVVIANDWSTSQGISQYACWLCLMPGCLWSNNGVYSVAMVLYVWLLLRMI